MKKAVTILTLIFSLAICCFGQKSEQKLVQKAFDNYKTAILNDKGDEDVKYVDSRTIKYYGEILELVKNADSATVNSLSLLDKLMVFTIRHKTSREDVLSFDGRGLLVYAIESGMVGKNSVANNSIGDVTIDADFAKGQFVANGQKTPLDFHFYKEEGHWKIDLTSIFAVSTMAFQKMAAESGQSENEYLFSLLEVLSGRKPGPEIWQTIK
jgi:hypothetical protein